MIYSSYLLDLLVLKYLPKVLGKFKRVLQPGGRIVLVNLSREDSEKLTWMERFYSWLPTAWVPYLLGSCRPVFMEPLVEAQGFVELKREFMSQLTRSEIVTARKLIRDRTSRSVAYHDALLFLLFQLGLCGYGRRGKFSFEKEYLLGL